MDHHTLEYERRNLLAELSSKRNSLLFYEGEAKRIQDHVDQHKAAIGLCEARLKEIEAELRADA